MCGIIGYIGSKQVLPILIDGLRRAGVDLDRKVLAELAVNEPGTFARVAEQAKGALAGDTPAEA